MYSYMSSGDDDDLDCILERWVSDEIVIMAMMELPQQHSCLQNLLGVLLAPMNDAISMWSCHSAKAGEGNFGEEDLARGLVYLSLMHYLGHTHTLLVM